MQIESSHDQHQQDAAATLALVTRARRAFKTRCTKSATAAPEGIRGFIERHGSDWCIVLRSAADELVAEYLIESGGTLCWVADGPARQAAQEQAGLHLVESLGGEALIARAIECLHSLNRLAKHLPRVLDHGPGWEYYPLTRRAPMAERIYGTKDQFLDAVVRAGRATVGTFTFGRTTRYMTCALCDRQWTGNNWCYACRDDHGIAETVSEEWFLIDCGHGYRFHQPTVSAEVKALAKPIEPHDPTQPPRDVPDVGLGMPAQLVCVQRATSFLLGLLADGST